MRTLPNVSRAFVKANRRGLRCAHTTKRNRAGICLLVIVLIAGILVNICDGQTKKKATTPRMFSSSDSSHSWVSIFPWGQKIYQLQTDVANPKVLYAATDLGLYRSTNSGMTWDRLAYGTGLTKAAFAQSRRNPAVMYFGIAFGQNGQQGTVFKSIDAGSNWSQVGRDDIKLAVENVQVDSDSPDTVYVVSASSNGAAFCTGCVLYKSMNGGRTWGNVAPNARSSIGPSSGYIRFLTVDEQRPGHLFANGYAWLDRAENDPSNLCESNDGGLSWQRRKEVVVRFASDRGYRSVACNWSSFILHPNNKNLIAGTADGNGWGGNYPPILVFSRDGGASWQNIKIEEKAPFRETAQMQSFAWSMAVPGIIYAGTSESLYKSAEYGQNWERVLPYRTSGIIASSSGDLYAATSIGLLKSKNGGRRWHVTGFGLPTGSGMNGCSLQAISGADIYVGCQGGFWSTADSGLTWKWIDIGADSTLRESPEIIPLRHGQDVRNLLVAQDKTIYLNLVTNDEGRVLKVQPDGTVVKIDLRGQAPHWLDFSPTDSKTLYLTVGTSSSFFAASQTYGRALTKSDDGGFSWQTFDLARWARPKVAGFSMTGVPLIAVSPKSSKIVYAVVTFLNQRTSQGGIAVEKTVDGGDHWRDIFTDPVLDLKLQKGQLGSLVSLVADPLTAETVYLVFSNALLRSDGNKWSELPFGKKGIGSLAISTSTPKMLYVATSAGVWSSRDGGAKWSSLMDGFYEQKPQKVLSSGPLTLAQGEHGIYRLTDQNLNWITQGWKTLEENPEANPIGLAP